MSFKGHSWSLIYEGSLKGYFLCKVKPFLTTVFQLLWSLCMQSLKLFIDLMQFGESLAFVNVYMYLIKFTLVRKKIVDSWSICYNNSASPDCSSVSPIMIFICKAKQKKCCVSANIVKKNRVGRLEINFIFILNFISNSSIHIANSNKIMRIFIELNKGFI
jgi:hypothetical protein